MFETDGIPSSWITKINQFDELWVPTEWGRSVFIKSGVKEDKLRVFGEPINTTHYNPSVEQSVDLFFCIEKGNNSHLPSFLISCNLNYNKGSILIPSILLKEKKEKSKVPYFFFLSIFKFEERKGYKTLLTAFVSAFRGYKGKRVVLFIRSSFDLVVRRIVVDYLRKEFGNDLDSPDFPTIVFISSSLKYGDLPYFYKAADAFVLPTRGEGFGLPLAEAMSMEIPVIATNWSGNTAFMHEDNSFPIKVDKFMRAKIENHNWAHASLSHLVEIMK